MSKIFKRLRFLQSNATKCVSKWPLKKISWDFSWAGSKMPHLKWPLKKNILCHFDLDPNDPLWRNLNQSIVISTINPNVWPWRNPNIFKQKRFLVSASLQANSKWLFYILYCHFDCRPQRPTLEKSLHSNYFWLTIIIFSCKIHLVKLWRIVCKKIFTKLTIAVS